MDLPAPLRLTVTDSTLLVIRLTDPIPDDEDGLTAALAALSETTPGSVLVVDDTVAEVTAQDREEAVTALAQALDDDDLEGTEAGMPLAEAVLRLLSAEGWALVRLR